MENTPIKVEPKKLAFTDPEVSLISEVIAQMKELLSINIAFRASALKSGTSGNTYYHNCPGIRFS